MLIANNLNLMGMSVWILMGPNLDELGPPFRMRSNYDRALCNLAAKWWHRHVKVSMLAWWSILQVSSRPALLQLAGTDAVGISTVPEVIVAPWWDARPGLSGISNNANMDGSTVTTHEEVMEAGKVITPKIEKIIRGVLRGM
jgi:purine-nucleoside phosphorylase